VSTFSDVEKVLPLWVSILSQMALLEGTFLLTFTDFSNGDVSEVSEGWR
jgi:hypothetical protein